MFVSPEFHTLGYNVYMCIYIIHYIYIDFILIIVLIIRCYYVLRIICMRACLLACHNNNILDNLYRLRYSVCV